MKNGLVLSLMALALASCGNGSGSVGSVGSIGSGGLFKRKADVVEVPLEYRDPRAFVPEIVGLSAKPVKGGVMVLAEGRTEMDGYHEVELARTNNGFPNEEGVLVLEFRAFLPNPAPRNKRADTIQAATFVSYSQLSGVRTIQVQAQSNSRSVSR